MLKTNYENIKRIASSSQKGFWRVQAIAKLDKEIRNGKTQYEYLKGLISKTNNKNNYPKSNLKLEIIPFLKPISNLKQKNQKKKKTKALPFFFLNSNFSEIRF